MQMYRGRHWCAACEAVAKQEDAEKRADAKPSETNHPTGYRAAATYGIGAALVVALLWEKMYFLLGFQSGVLNGVMGGAVGIAVLMGAQRSGAKAGLIGAVSAAIMIWFGHLLLVYDLMQKYGRHDLSLLLFLRVLGTFSVTHWLFVALGVAAAIVIPWKFGPLSFD